MKICYICKEKFEDKYVKGKNYRKVRVHYHYTWEYRGAAQNICNIKYSVPKKMSITFHNGSNYYYHFIIKELAEEFKKQCTCLRENTEKYINFTILIGKEVTRIDKNGEEITKNKSYTLHFIDSTRFVAISLSNLANNLFKGIHKIQCRYGYDDKKCETCRIKYKYGDCLLEYTNFKDDLLEYKCLCCDKNYQQKFDEKFKDRFFNTYKFFNHDNNKFILLLWKDICLYEYLDGWEKLNETSLPEKDDFYSHLNMEDITDADYAHAKKF